MTRQSKFFFSLVCSFGLIIVFERFLLGDLAGLVGSITLPQLYILFIAIFACCIYPSRVVKFWSKNLWVLLLILFFMFSEFISAIISNSEPVKLFRTRFISFLPFIAITPFVKTIGIEKFFFGFVLSSIILTLSIIISALGYVTFSFGDILGHRYWFADIFSYRSSGLLLNYGDVSIILSLGLASSLYYLSSYKNCSKLKFCLSLISIILLPLGIIGSESRNCILSCILVLFVWSGWFKNVSKIWKHLSILVTLLAVIYLVSNLNIVFQFFDSMYSLRGREDARIFQVITFFNSLPDMGLFGYGPGNFVVYAINAQGEVENSIHNIFLQGFSRSGIGGFALLILFVITFVKLKRIKNGYPLCKENFAVFSAFLGYASALQFYPALSYGSPIVWLPMAMFFGYFLKVPRK